MAKETIPSEQFRNITAKLHMHSEQALWRAVITQALMDAASQSSKPADRLHKQEAVKWLTSVDEHFRTVCDYAGFDPHYIARMVEAALARRCRWRVEHVHDRANPHSVYTKARAKRRSRLLRMQSAEKKRKHKKENNHAHA